MNSHLSAGPSSGLLLGELLSTPPPAFNAQDAQHAAQEHYGLNVEARELSGERDRTFLLSQPDGKRFILKISNPVDSQSMRTFQYGVLRHIETTDPSLPVPRLIATRAGLDEFKTTGSSGSELFGSMTSFLNGAAASAQASTRARRLSFGQTLAALDAAMANYSHPSDDRLLSWDLMHCIRLMPIVEAIEGATLRRQISEFLRRFDEETRPAVETLRPQIIHNDANNSNLLVAQDNEHVVSGIIDFGDMVRAPLVNEVAVCASYEVHGSADPIACILDVIEGFSRITPLEPLELRHLLDLVIARLSVRMLITSWRAERFPENRAYILRNTRSARDAFEALIDLPASDGRLRIERHGRHFQM
ncbi:phosphotransferase [Paraburkholderia tropica]|uniref:phosphotransferase n=1 Tax=Paraburkholderia tropica TaxID=92647 RepID=UPI0018D2DE91|nr:phosphotransferase [Paraburkholderia tropica]